MKVIKTIESQKRARMTRERRVNRKTKKKKRGGGGGVRSDGTDSVFVKILVKIPI